jgi:hypothetical protein
VSWTWPGVINSAKACPGHSGPVDLGGPSTRHTFTIINHLPDTPSRPDLRMVGV